MTQPEHIPVMVEEVLAALTLRPGAVAVDGTLGLAGHSSRLAERLIPDGLLVGLDWDAEMLERAGQKLGAIAGLRCALFHADFRELPGRLEEACAAHGFEPGADAVLLDLGLNNAQIEDPERGFSFMRGGPLDMRMDKRRGEPASAVLNRMGQDELAKALWDLGGERWAKRIAQVVVERRRKEPLRTTQDLVACVELAIPPAKRDRRIHCATRTFQAVRLLVNRELVGLEEAVEAAARCLRPGGAITVLAYHSGEDRAVKTVFHALAKTEEFEEPHRKPLVPSDSEKVSNPKSRSAKLRTLRRIA